MQIELSPANEWIDTQMKFIRPQETKPLYMLQQGSPPTSLVKDAICCRSHILLPRNLKCAE